MTVNQLDLSRKKEPISPWLEMGAYEALWAKTGTTFKSLAAEFSKSTSMRPSDFIEPKTAEEFASKADSAIKASSSHQYGVRIHGTGEYPQKLREAKHPVELLYYQGVWALTETPSVSIVGTRQPSAEGIARTEQIARVLAEKGFTIVSGLAAGIDRVAHETALSLSKWTIAVIGTPLSVFYPKENRNLQEELARCHLVISQVPVATYKAMSLTKKRTFFPERNVTMSALSDATIIVEAGETSGTLTQARAAIEQGRKLFILESCFNRSDLTWPKRFEEQGAIRVRNIDDILSNLDAPNKDRSDSAS